MLKKNVFKKWQVISYLTFQKAQQVTFYILQVMS